MIRNTKVRLHPKFRQDTEDDLYQITGRSSSEL